MRKWICALLALLAMALPALAQVEIAPEALPQGDPREAAEELGALALQIGDMEALDGEGRAYRRGDHESGAFTEIVIEEYASDAVGTRLENTGYEDLSVYGIYVGMEAEAARAALLSANLKEVRPEYALDSEIVFESEAKRGFVALTIEDGMVASFVFQNFEDAGWYY